MGASRGKTGLTGRLQTSAAVSLLTLTCCLLLAIFFSCLFLLASSFFFADRSFVMLIPDLKINRKIQILQSFNHIPESFAHFIPTHHIFLPSGIYIKGAQLFCLTVYAINKPRNYNFPIVSSIIVLTLM